MVTDEGTEEREPDLVCAACEHPVTREDSAIEIADRHRHTCVNPSGIVFRVRCFRDAPGCVGQGEITDFYSWFAGYGWQIALCARCAAHLGWLFSGREPSFAGLIADRIAKRA